MTDLARSLGAFVTYAGTLEGDEKGEAQVFCDRLFQAFGHGGYKEAGATLECRRNDCAVGAASRLASSFRRRRSPLLSVKPCLA